MQWEGGGELGGVRQRGFSVSIRIHCYYYAITRRRTSPGPRPATQRHKIYNRVADRTLSGTKPPLLIARLLLHKRTGEQKKKYGLLEKAAKRKMRFKENPK